MSGFFVPLAAAETFERQVEAARTGGQFGTREILIALTIGLVVAGVLFFAVFLYYRRKHRKEERERPGILISKPAKSADLDPSDEGGEDSEPERRRRRKRRRKRDHRPRNPTLDKTGGLPPLRPDDDIPKF